MSNISSFGNDSPFAFLHINKGEMLIIGLDYQHSFTFVHYVEEIEKVDYRYIKEFKSEYVDENGLSNIRTYTMFVRDIERGVESNLNSIGEILENKGISVEKVINGVSFKLIGLSDAFLEIQKDIRENKAINLYKITP